MTDERYQNTRARLAAHGQEHLLTFYDELDDQQKTRLLDQIDEIDLEQVDRLIETHVKDKPLFELPANLDPAPFYPMDPPAELEDKYTRARQTGDQLIREGKVAAFVVAGGSGTRLGWDGPKGTFPASPITGKSLFQLFAEFIRKVELKYDTTVPWYVMTSPANDQATRDFFDEHDHFGLRPDNVCFFAQGTMPCIDYHGYILLDDKDQIARSADGHGGSLKALYRSGAIDDMARRGIEHISYFQVDNPLVKCVDPLFVGLHALDNARMSSKMVAKSYGKEKLGNFCVIDGKITIVEYSDLPDDLAEQRLPSGELRFQAGSPAIHAIAVDFVRQLNATGELALPFHRADKKVPHLDLQTGQRIEPTAPNAVKLEQFVFDALPRCDTSIVLQTTREEEMAFIKNADGESSPATSRQMQIDRAGRWLQSVGVEVPWGEAGHVDARIELSPLTALEPADLRDADLPTRIESGSELVL